MIPLLSRLFSRLHPLRRATSPEEREAIYRFRHSVLVDELKRVVPGADSQKKQVRDEEDEAPWTTQLYVGSPEEVTCALRVRCFAPGTVPPATFDGASLDLLPGADRLAIGDVGRLLARPSLGLRGLVPSLAAGVGELMAERGVELIVLSCRPGLVPRYRALGARPFGGRLINRAEGIEVPLLLVPSDVEHLRKVRSPAAAVAERLFGPGKRAPTDVRPFAERFAGAERSIVTDPEAVSTEFQKALLGGRQPPVFLRSLREETVRRLASEGFILGVVEDAIITREGRSGREMYAVLEGSYEVTIRGARVAVLGRGDLFGEVAFFTSSGRRSATVRALERGRLVVIRPRFLEELSRQSPRAAVVILQNLARILAERIERSTPPEPPGP